MRIICFIKTCWHSFSSLLRTGNATPIMGHSYIEKEVHNNVNCQILECEDCGHISVSWSREKFPE